MLFQLRTSLAAAAVRTVGMAACWAAAAMAAGCGQKGPLTLPPAGPASAPMSTPAAPASSAGASLPAAPVPTPR